jgi:GNAT superfamily N-acetyltransferase
VLLTAEVQLEYVRRYDSPVGDSAPIDASEFVPPNGLFVVGLDDGVPVAMGGWRRYGPDGDTVGVGELKRMYVRESARGRGISRLLLAHLEHSALAAGITRLVLETGTEQPEAIALYRSCGYVDVEPFGHYVGYDDSVHLGKNL